MVEHAAVNRGVTGSSPVAGAISLSLASESELTKADVLGRAQASSEDPSISHLDARERAALDFRDEHGDDSCVACEASFATAICYTQLTVHFLRISHHEFARVFA